MQETARAADLPSLALRAAWLYYEEDLTQQQVAERLGLSRFQVLRLIQKARTDGLVSVTVRVPNAGLFSLERRIEKEFGVRECVVAPGEDADPRPALGRAAAELLARTLEEGVRLGVAFSTTLEHVLAALPPLGLTRSTVVQLTGGMAAGDEPTLVSAAFPARLATTIGGAVHVLHAPAFVRPPARRALLAEPVVARVLEAGRSCDVALVGVGLVSETNSLMRTGFVSPDQLEDLRHHGASAEVLCRFLDARGQSVATELERRVVGLDIRELKAIPKVIGVAGGPAKFEALRAVLSGDLLDVLVTDEKTARRLVAGSDQCDHAAGAV